MGWAPGPFWGQAFERKSNKNIAAYIVRGYAERILSISLPINIYNYIKRYGRLGKRIGGARDKADSHTATYT
jgi:hypothetical protein